MERTQRRPLENSLTLALIADALRKEVVAVVREQLAAGERLTVDAVVDEVLALHDDGEQDLLGDEDPKPADDSKLGADSCSRCGCAQWATAKCMNLE